MTVRTATRRQIAVPSAVLAIGMLWGATFPLAAVAGRDVGPAGAALGGITVGTAFLGLAAWYRGVGLRDLLSRFHHHFVLAMINIAGPLWLIMWASSEAGSALTATLNGFIPAATVLIVWGWLRQRPSRWQLGGTVLGAAGVVTVAGWPKTGGTSLAGAVVAFVAFALAFVYADRYLKESEPLAGSAFQHVLAIPALVAAVVLYPPGHVPSPVAIGAMIGFGIGPTAIAYTLYLWLIRRAGAVAAASINLVVPVMGAVAGVTLLREPFGWQLVGGGVLVLGSVALLAPRQSARHGQRRWHPAHVGKPGRHISTRRRVQ